MSFWVSYIFSVSYVSSQKGTLTEKKYSTVIIVWNVTSRKQDLAFVCLFVRFIKYCYYHEHKDKSLM